MVNRSILCCGGIKDALEDSRNLNPDQSPANVSVHEYECTLLAQASGSDSKAWMGTLYKGVVMATQDSITLKYYSSAASDPDHDEINPFYELTNDDIDNLGHGFLHKSLANPMRIVCQAHSTMMLYWWPLQASIDPRGTVVAQNFIPSGHQALSAPMQSAATSAPDWLAALTYRRPPPQPQSRSLLSEQQGVLRVARSVAGPSRAPRASRVSRAPRSSRAPPAPPAPLPSPLPTVAGPSTAPPAPPTTGRVRPPRPEGAPGLKFCRTCWSWSPQWCVPGEKRLCGSCGRCKAPVKFQNQGPAAVNCDICQARLDREKEERGTKRKGKTM